MARLQNSFALLVGIAAYQSPNIQRLPRAVRNDVRRVRRLLKSSKHCGYEDVRLLLDTGATRAAILAALADLAKRADKTSTVFLFFSCHGASRGSDQYLLPADTVMTNRGQLQRDTAISGREFTQHLAKVLASRLFLALDCCHSSGIAALKGAEGGKLKLGLRNSFYSQMLASGEGRVILASCAAEEESAILKGARNSLFTTHLVNGLKGGASSDGSPVTVFDLFEYVQPRVTSAYAEQHPVFKADLRTNFPLAIPDSADPGAVPELIVKAAVVELPPCPYPGMRAFIDTESDLFFGRSDEVADMVARLRSRKLLLLVGASGCGKSSLVLAGLMPELRRSSLFGPGAWAAETVEPQEATAGEREKVERVDAAVALRTRLQADGKAPEAVVRDLVGRSKGASRLVLFVDHLERLFAPAVEGASAFLELLLAMSRHPDCYVVMACRADYYPELTASRLGRMLKTHQLTVLPLDGDALREAIVGPAERVGVAVEPGLEERLAAHAGGRPGALPLLQETLWLLWHRLRRRQMSLEAYEAMGRDGRNGVEVALADHAEKTLDSIKEDPEVKPDGEEITRRIFVRLVQFGDGRHTGRRVPEGGLRGPEDPVRFKAVLKALVEARLLSPGEMGEFRVAHEALFDAWPTLRQWIKDHREAEETRRRLVEAAEAWEGSKRLGGLLDEFQLQGAQTWRDSKAGKEVGCPTDVSALMEASEDAIQRRRKAEQAAAEREKDLLRQRNKAIQRQREEERAAAEREIKLQHRIARTWKRWAGLLAGALLIAIAAASAAFYYERHARAQARTAESRRLAALALQHLARGEARKSLCCAIQANRVETNPETREALMASLAQFPCEVEYLPGIRPPNCMAISGDGRIVAFAYQSRIEFRDASKPGLPVISSMDTPVPIMIMVLDQDGSRGVAAGTGVTYLLELQMEHVAVIAEVPWSDCIAIAPVGDHFATGARTPSLDLWSFANGSWLANSVQIPEGFVPLYLDFDESGEHFVAGELFGDCRILVWDLANLKSPARTIRAPDHLTCVRFIDGDIWCSTEIEHSLAWNRTTSIWTRRLGEEGWVQEDSTPGRITSISKSRSPVDVQWVALEDRTLRVGGSGSAAGTAGTISLQRGPRHDAALSRLGNLLVSGTDDECMMLWRLCKDRSLYYKIRPPDSISRIARISYDAGGGLVVKGGTGKLCLLDPSGAAPRMLQDPATFREPTDPGVTAEERARLGVDAARNASIAGDSGKHLLAVVETKMGPTQHIQLFDRTSNRLIGPPLPFLDGMQTGPASIAMSDDGTWVAVGMSGSYTVHFWNLDPKHLEEVAVKILGESPPPAK